MRDLLRNTRRFLSGLKPVKVPDAPARAFRDLVDAGARRRAAASVVARLTGASANDLYEAYE